MNQNKSKNDNEKFGNNSNNNSMKKDGGNQEKKGNNGNNQKNNNQNNNNNNHSANQGGNKGEGGILKQLMNLIERCRKGSRTYPLDSPVLYIMYRVFCMIFYHFAMISIFNVFYKDPIVCAEGYNAETKLDPFITNICQSYPFMKVSQTEDERRYILFYKWIPHLLLYIASMFYLPRIVMKWCNPKQLHHLLEDLSKISHIYDNNNWGKTEEKIVHYIQQNFRNHGNLYRMLVLNHAFSVGLVMGIFWLLDFMFQGHFLTLPLDILPFQRDPRQFLDKLSFVFPPFVNCQIGPIGELGMKGGRAETYKCHLTLMELYEKLFFVIWFILTSYLIVSIVSVFVLLLLLIPPFKQFFLSSPSQMGFTKAKCRYLLRKLSIGDIYCLYLIKKRITPIQFCGLIDSVHSFVFNQGTKAVEPQEDVSKEAMGIPQEFGFVPRAPTPPVTRRNRRNRNDQKERSAHSGDIGIEDIV